jgi:hypothetical protein
MFVSLVLGPSLQGDFVPLLARRLARHRCIRVLPSRRWNRPPAERDGLPYRCRVVELPLALNELDLSLMGGSVPVVADLISEVGGIDPVGGPSVALIRGEIPLLGVERLVVSFVRRRDSVRQHRDVMAVCLTSVVSRPARHGGEPPRHRGFPWSRALQQEIVLKRRLA